MPGYGNPSLKPVKAIASAAVPNSVARLLPEADIHPDEVASDKNVIRRGIRIRGSGSATKYRRVVVSRPYIAAFDRQPSTDDACPKSPALGIYPRAIWCLLA